MDHPKANRIVLQEIRQVSPCRLGILVYNLVVDNLREGVSHWVSLLSAPILISQAISRRESFIGELHCLYNFLFSHRKEPRHVPTEHREGQLPKTRSKAIGKRVRVGHGNDTVLLDRVHCIQGARQLTGKDGHARSECLCRETETRKQASTADWPQHDVEIGNLIDKLDHYRSLTGDHERIVKRGTTTA